MESQHNNESNFNLTYKKFNMLYIDKNEKRKKKAFRRHTCTQDILKPNQWMIDHKIVFRTRRERYNILPYLDIRNHVLKYKSYRIFDISSYLIHKILGNISYN